MVSSRKATEKSGWVWKDNGPRVETSLDTDGTTKFWLAADDEDELVRKIEAREAYIAANFPKDD